MTKVTVFYLISSKFLSTFFLGTSFFSHIPNKDPTPIIYLTFKPNNWFFRLFRPKNWFFRRKKIFLRLCRPKN